MTDGKKTKMGGGGDAPVKELTERELSGVLVLTYAGTILAKKFEPDPDSAVPEVSRARVRSFIRTKEAEFQKEKRFRFWRAVAMFLIVFLLANVVLVSTVEAYREALIRVITRNGQHAIDVHFENDSDAEPIDPSVLVYEPTYLPEGFIIDHIDSWIFGTTVCYKNDNKTLWFEQNSSNAGYSIDNEHGETGVIEINSNEGVYIELEDEILLVWSDGTATFRLKGALPISELKKVAEGVTKK